jgi:hypothetical protein
MSTLDAMEEEHGLIDPLLAAVDHVLADREAADGHLGDVIGELTGKLTHHLAHEERDTLPLIGITLTTGEWSAVLTDIRARGSAADAMEMVPWLLDKLPPEAIAQLLSSFLPLVAPAGTASDRAGMERSVFPARSASTRRVSGV